MKRILSIILIIMLIFPAIPVFAENVVAEENSKEIEKVLTLGIMTGFPDGTFRAEEGVTRAEFACIVTNLLNLKVDAANGEATAFYDVTSSHWASPYVNIVSSRGLMNGSGDGLFLPEKTITVVEAAKVMVELLGYGYFAENSGGYPTGYYMQAESMDLLDGINSKTNEIITRGDIAKMLCSCFETDMYYAYSYGEDVGITKQDGVTILSKYHDIYSVEGVVTANKFTAVNGESNLRENEIEIDSQRYEISDNDTNLLIGMNVSAYYKENNDGTYTIVYISPEDNEEITLLSEDISNINGYNIYYFTESGKKRYIEIESNSNIILNNQFECRSINFDFTRLSSVNGTITFIDNDSDGQIEIINIKDYTTGVIDSVNPSLERINLKYDARPLVLEEFTYVIRKGNEEINITDLTSSSVISIAASSKYLNGDEDGVIEIIVSDKTVTGTVTATSDANVTITNETSSVKYEISSKYISEQGNTIKVGDKGIFYLDPNDKIISCSDGGSGDIKFGYLIKAIKKEEIDTRVLLKIFTSTGTMEIYESNDTVRLDGKPVKATEMYDTLKSMSGEGQISMIVRYGVNSANKLNVIDTELPNSDGDIDELTVKHINITGGLRYQSPGTILVSYQSPERYVLTGSTVVFVIPLELSDEDLFRVSTRGYFSNENYYGDTTTGQHLYMCNVKDGSPAAIFINTKAATTSLGAIDYYDDSAAVVVKKVLAMDADGEVCTKVTVNSHGSMVDLYVTDKTNLLFMNGTRSISRKLPGASENLTINDFNLGDVVMYDKDTKNRANTLLRINDTNIWELEHGEYQVTDMSGYTEFIMGSVRKKIGTALELDATTEPNLYINAFEGPYVYIVNKRAQTVTAGSLKDICASDSDAEADKIFARVRFGNVKEIVIYRD